MYVESGPNIKYVKDSKHYSLHPGLQIIFFLHSHMGVDSNRCAHASGKKGFIASRGHSFSQTSLSCGHLITARPMGCVRGCAFATAAY
jgi:hypothetical protein